MLYRLSVEEYEKDEFRGSSYPKKESLPMEW